MTCSIRRILFATNLMASLLVTGSLSAGTATIVLTDAAVPEGNGQFSSFDNAVLNNLGQVGFYSVLKNTSGGTADDTGIYLFDGASLLNRVRENDFVPDGNGRFANIAAGFDFTLNSVGQVVVLAQLKNTSGGTTDDTSIYLHNGSALVNTVRENAIVPGGNGRYDFLVYTGASANNSGQVAFPSTLKNTSGGTTDDTGLFLNNGSAIVSIARENALVPEGNGRFDFAAVFPSTNNAGQIAFAAGLRNTSGGTTDDSGVYLYNGSALVNRARENDLAPDGNGRFDGFSVVGLNDAGQIALFGFLKNTSGGSADDLGIYLHNGSALVKIVRKNDAVPEGNGLVNNFSTGTALNNAGQIVFSASLKNTAGGATDNSGIYLYNGSALVNLARKNDAVPDGNGNFNSLFFNPNLNNGGQVAFKATLNNTAGGATDDAAIYLADGQEQMKVVRKGDVLGGRTISDLILSGGGSNSASGLSDFAQVAYQASFTDGTQGVFVFTPQLRWRSTSSGIWDTPSNWTLGINPAAPHDVTIDPAVNLTVTGPAGSVAIQSLVVGGGAGVATLELQLGGGLNTASGLTIQPSGTITGDSTINVNGNLTVTGGALNLGSTSTLTLAPSSTFVVQSGGIATFTGPQMISNSLTIVSGTGSSLSTVDRFDIGSAALVQVSSGGVIAATTNLSIGSDGIASAVAADGVASTITAGIMSVGAAAGGTATVTLSNNASLAAGATQLNATGVIDITNSTVSLGTLTYAGGLINFNSGSLSYAGDLTVGLSGILGSDLTLAGNRQLALTGTTTIDSFHTLTLAGGTLSTGSLVVNGTLAFNSGTLGISGAGGLTIGTSGSLGANVTLNSGTILRVTNSTIVDAAASLTVSGGNFSTGSLVNSGNVVVDAGSLTAFASLTNQPGGFLFVGSNRTATFGTASTNAGEIEFGGAAATIGGAGTLTNTGLIRGDGKISNVVTNNVNGEIRAETGKRIKLGGTNGINSGKVNLQGGTAEFSQPLTNGTAGQIVGRGTLITGGTGLTNNGNIAFSGGLTDVFGDVNNSTGSLTKGISISGNAGVTFWDDVTNGAGSLFRVSGGSSVTVFGTYSGAGISGTGSVYYGADISPGFSPATVNYGGNVALDSTARLKIELGGAAPGTQFDQVKVTGQLALAGTLNVSLINGYSPAVGNSFDILDWGSLSGTFATVNLPTMNGRVVWDTSHLYASDSSGGTLSVLATYYAGDVNRDSQVTVADISTLMTALADVSKYRSDKSLTDPTLFKDVADVNGDGKVNNLDIQSLIALVASNIVGGGAVPGSAIGGIDDFASSAPPINPVPEPASIVLLGIGALAIVFRRRSR